jgi:hypothetical protein
MQASQDNWTQSNAQIYWSETASCKHLLQLYETDKVLISSLESFAGTGLLGGESVVVIATAGHLVAIQQRLSEHGFNLESLKLRNQLILIDARDAMKSFMVDGMPDEGLFREIVGAIYHRARHMNRKVRAFGEIVAVLVREGNAPAAIALEKIWNSFCGIHKLTLFCAYPQSITTDPVLKKSICDHHSQMISGGQQPTTEVHYHLLA